jgi:hypothetical protein
MGAEYFASSLIAELREGDPLADALRTRGRGQTAVIGVEDDGEFVPLLRLTGASAKFNVMSLLVYHHGRWQPTFKRGTPAELAVPLKGELRHLWSIPVEMAHLAPVKAADRATPPSDGVTPAGRRERTSATRY